MLMRNRFIASSHATDFILQRREERGVSKRVSQKAPASLFNVSVVEPVDETITLQTPASPPKVR